MQERLMEILVKLLQEMHGTTDIQVMLKDLSEELRLQGYSETELSMALSWLTAQIERQGERLHSLSPLKGSVRVLHPVERMMLKADAYGYLLRLQQLGFIDMDQIEAIIERALSSGKSVITVHDIKMVIASLGSDSEQMDWMAGNASKPDDETNVKVH